MKKFKWIIPSLLVILSVCILVGFEKNEKYHFNLKVNTEYLNLIQTSSPALLEGGNTKFGGDLGKSSLNVHFTDFTNQTQINEHTTKQDSNFKGVIKTVDGNYNFEGTGEMYTVELSNNEVIKVGEYSGNIRNKNEDDVLTLSVRYNPESDEIDIVAVSGIAGNVATLPFGQPFLFNDELDEIRELKSNIE